MRALIGEHTRIYLQQAYVFGAQTLITSSHKITRIKHTTYIKLVTHPCREGRLILPPSLFIYLIPQINQGLDSAPIIIWNKMCCQYPGVLKVKLAPTDRYITTHPTPTHPPNERALSQTGGLWPTSLCNAQRSTTSTCLLWTTDVFRYNGHLDTGQHRGSLCYTGRLYWPQTPNKGGTKSRNTIEWWSLGNARPPCYPHQRISRVSSGILIFMPSNSAETLTWHPSRDLQQKQKAKNKTKHENKHQHKQTKWQNERVTRNTKK